MNPWKRRLNVSLRQFLLAASLAMSMCGLAHAQANSTLVDPLLAQHLQSPSIVSDELRHFMLQRVPPLQNPATAKQWDQDAAKIRAHQLDVVYHGWPQAWVDSAPKFEKVGVIERKGYRIVKLRYEIVPGFESTALLYEPEHMTGKMPAILDVNGHGPGGKAVEHKQKRCINQARRGIIALSPEFINFGELSAPGSEHSNIGLLDLAGDNGLGLFYLSMRRGIDYLYNDPDVDRSRIGVTGLSGGGFQTIVLSSLDTRVGAAAPAAGFSTLTTAIEHPEYLDAEQNATDFRQDADYAQLVAIRAPRPTLLIYNAMDDCCFRGNIVKQGVYSDIKPFFNLYGKPDNLQWHLNLDPGAHNYGLDNRQASYKFFDSAFHLDASEEEDADTDSEVLSFQDLVVGLPKDNLTILGLARSFAKSIHHDVPADHGATWAQSQRDLLTKVVRYAPVTVTHAWAINSTHEKGLESAAYRFEFSNGLSATGVLFRSITAPETAPITVIVSDLGMPSTIDDVANEVDRGQRVLVLDPLFFGENTPAEPPKNNPDIEAFTELLNSIGQRPLGLEAAQIVGVVRWLSKDLDLGSPTPRLGEVEASIPTRPVRIVTTGLRSETVAMVAVALNPELFSRFEARQAIPSLAYAFDHPLTYTDAPELMCLDLYKDFDFTTLTAIASPVNVNLSAVAPKRIFWE
jgi:dienelactone hydrolase